MSDEKKKIGDIIDESHQSSTKSKEQRGHKKHKHKSSKNAFFDYVITSACFTAVAVVVMIVTAFIAIKPAQQLVHKVEAQLNMQVRDIQITQTPSAENAVFGEKLANISCEDNGINCSVYYGSNRASMRCGAGLDTNQSTFGADGVSVITGYDSTYFASLKNTDIGDVFIVISNGKEYSYRVYNTELTDKGEQSYDMLDDNTLVLRSIFSDFSENSSKSFCVFAQLIDSREAQ